MFHLAYCIKRGESLDDALEWWFGFGGEPAWPIWEGKIVRFAGLVCVIEWIEGGEGKPLVIKIEASQVEPPGIGALVRCEAELDLSQLGLNERCAYKERIPFSEVLSGETWQRDGVWGQILQE